MPPMLPCEHSQLTLQQIRSTIDLLKNLHNLHPQILKEHNISPESYIDEMIFRSAVESIRGTYIASSQKQRESMIGDFLQVMKEKEKIYDYQYTGQSARCDYIIDITETYKV